jgi:carbonic anhydrase/acetyltransferase-like protein (isoleucine patch superfamily)
VTNARYVSACAKSKDYCKEEDEEDDGYIEGRTLPSYIRQEDGTIISVKELVLKDKHGNIADTIAPNTVGGWIASEKNLSPNGNCWVYPGARIEDDAQVSGHARIQAGKVEGTAQISGHAVIHLSGSGRISDAARIDGDVQITANSVIEDNARITGENMVIRGTTIKDNVRLTGKARNINGVMVAPEIIASEISGNARLDIEDALISGSTIKDLATISGRPTIEDSTVSGQGKVAECAQVRIGSEITERAQVMGSTKLNAVVLNKQAYVATKSPFFDLTISTYLTEEYDLNTDCA